MVAIDNVLVSMDIVQQQFVCDLHACKGACCVDGDAGAPLNEDELPVIDEIYETVKPYLTQEGVAAVEAQGKYYHDDEFGWVTPAIKGKMCAYGIIDEQGIVKCGIEQAYYDKKINWKKPISCHLFPIRISQSRSGDTDYLNYEERPSTCSAACKLGKQLKVPVYEFLKEPLIRKYGEEFYEALDATAKHIS